ncbi:MAG TPA: hypothetical protein VGD58_14115 [Herpetosiphonaceae bacterium]
MTQSSRASSGDHMGNPDRDQTFAAGSTPNGTALHAPGNLARPAERNRHGSVAR